MNIHAEPQDRSYIGEMVGLLGSLTRMMFRCGMPDAAMDALFVAHDSITNEIILSTSLSADDVTHKETALAILVSYNVDNIWSEKKDRIMKSMKADRAMLTPLEHRRTPA